MFTEKAILLSMGVYSDTKYRRLEEKQGGGISTLAPRSLAPCQHSQSRLGVGGPSVCVAFIGY